MMMMMIYIYIYIYDVLHKTESPRAGKAKPRSVRRRFANPPPEAEGEALKQESKKKNIMRTSDSMGKASGGEGFRRMSRRTASWQHKPSSCVPDFDEVAARVDALSRN
jgi:hypothetical protein